MAKIGYARVSTAEQDNTVQVEALRAAGCSMVREEKASGTSRQGRPELELALAILREGDTLVVTRIDRLARSVEDLQKIVRAVRERGAALACTEQPVDTSTAAGKAFLDMLGVFAEFETNLRRERQAEGVAQAKADGVYVGRKPSYDAKTLDEVVAMLGRGAGASEIAAATGLTRQTVLRIKADPQKARTVLDGWRKAGRKERVGAAAATA